VSYKTVVTSVLLLFVAASVVALAVKNLRPGPQPAAAEVQRDGVTVYYFHGKMRCPTCQSIEAYAHEAVSSAFANELKDGRIEWKVVDFEQPENEHFAKDFELAVSSVVLVETRGGARKNWKNLPEVWELVGDKPAFIAFVQKEVRAFLNPSQGAAPP
jgi:hypothetical protein